MLTRYHTDRRPSSDVPWIGVRMSVQTSTQLYACFTVTTRTVLDWTAHTDAHSYAYFTVSERTVLGRSVCPNVETAILVLLSLRGRSSDGRETFEQGDITTDNPHFCIFPPL